MVSVMPSRARWVVLGILSSALLLIVIDMTVLYTALPRLTQDLRASATEKLWIVNAYALAVAGLLPAMGALGDRYGAKRMFVGGLAVFGAASLLAAFSPDPATLIAARVVLALGAAMMLPATLSLVRQIFEDPAERALAIGVWASAASGGAAFGPVVGGALLERFWWGSVFVINVPIVVAALGLALVLIPEGRRNPDRPFDPWGALQVLVGLVGAVYAVKAIGKPVPAVGEALVAGTVGLLFLGLFLRRQRRAAVPMIDVGLFANRRFAAAALTALVAMAVLVGVELAVSQRFQLALGLSPLQAGLALLPIPLASFVAGPLAGALIPRIGAERMLWGALVVAGLGTLGHAVGADAGLAVQIAAFVVLGLGSGAAMTAASSAIMMSAPADRAGMAASIEEVSFELGNALGVAILGSLLAAAYSGAFVAPAAVAGATVAGAAVAGAGIPGAGVSGAELARDSIDAALIAAEGLGGEAGAALAEAARRAFHDAFVLVLAVGSAMLLAAAGAIALAVRRAA